VQRKRQAENGDRATLGRSAAGHPGAGGAAADDERKAAQFAAAELLDDRRPGLVEPVGRSE
jgi:hypothetical protein